MIFLDTEFVELGGTPRLLSIALVSTADEHYSEIDVRCEVGKRLLLQASPFVLDHVVGQLGVIRGASVSTFQEIGHRVGDWLQQQGEDVVEIGYDYHTDFDLLEEVLRAAHRWMQLEARLSPVHLGYLLDAPGSRDASETIWSQTSNVGLGRHHALADARALKAAFESLHGALS